MRKILLLWIVVFSLAACSRSDPKPLSPDAPPEAVPEISGDYVVNGFDPTGIEYGGRLKITPGDQPGEYVLQWIISGDLQAGVGRLNGNRLEVTWRSQADLDRGQQGTASFTVTTAGELYGPRYMEGYPNPGSETAYPNTPENMSD